MARRYFEDFAVGESFALPERVVTRAEIIAFAVEHDPQPAHLDERASPNDFGGGISASGWHVCAVFMRSLCEAVLLDAACLGSPGVDRLEWPGRLRPGDRLSGRSTVIGSRASRSRPDFGIVQFRHEARNQAGDLVMWMEGPILVSRRGRPG